MRVTRGNSNMLLVCVYYLFLWYKNVFSQAVPTKKIVFPIIKRIPRNVDLIQLMFSKTMSQVNV